MPDIAAHRHQLDLVGWGMQPADDDMGFSLAFRGYIQLSHLARGAAAKAPTSRRRVISRQWVGEDVVVVKRRGIPSAPFPDLYYEDGASFTGPEFPIIYPAK